MSRCPPKGAPNVLVVPLDDVGFAASSAFGGPCADTQFREARLRRTEIQSFPHYRALLTDEPSATHRAPPLFGWVGGITELATSAPGYSSILPKNKAPLPMTLKLNGDSTAQFGKCHEVPVWETSPMGPFDQWPTGGGGFEISMDLSAARLTSRPPRIYEGTIPVEPAEEPEEGYHFTEDVTTGLSPGYGSKALMADKPFFIYFAPGACHAPHHVPKKWADKYKGNVRSGVGQIARGDFGEAEESRRGSAKCRIERSDPRRFKPGMKSARK